VERFGLPAALSESLRLAKEVLSMSHHYSGPNVGFPRGDARLDFTDLYAFPSPADPSRLVLIMNVHPAFSLLPPGPTTPEPFAADAIYEFKIDTNGDAVADIAYRMRFSAFANGKQTAVLRRVEGRPGRRDRRRGPAHRTVAGLDG
jgi:hypothetical protein